VLVLLYGAGFHFLAFGLPGGGLPPNKLTMCWRDLARQVAAIKDEVAAETGARPLAIGMDKYHTSSSLAFYEPSGRGAAETASVHLFGRPGFMYAYWFPGPPLKGRSIILVGMRPDSFEDERMLQGAERLGPLRELPVIKQGRRVATYYARVAYGYRGTTAWERPGLEPDTDPDE
jgi:dolichol-phosphate mannosyltransferase